MRSSRSTGPLAEAAQLIADLEEFRQARPWGISVKQYLVRRDLQQLIIGNWVIGLKNRTIFSEVGRHLHLPARRILSKTSCGKHRRQSKSVGTRENPDGLAETEGFEPSIRLESV